MYAHTYTPTQHGKTYSENWLTQGGRRGVAPPAICRLELGWLMVQFLIQIQKAESQGCGRGADISLEVCGGSRNRSPDVSEQKMDV
jgi:hypothetical protein